ncbi:hypothetical protein ACVOMS_11285 [Bradyrhizobium guangxiense]
MQTRTHEQLVADFLAEIETAIRVHTKAYRKDAFWYQLIVVASAISGLLSLILGTAFKSPAVAGIFGGATTIATVLTQTLHCVKAQGWQDRMKSEARGDQAAARLRTRLRADAGRPGRAVASVSRPDHSHVEGMGTHHQQPGRRAQPEADPGQTGPGGRLDRRTRSRNR